MPRGDSGNSVGRFSLLRFSVRHVTTRLVLALATTLAVGAALTSVAGAAAVKNKPSRVRMIAVPGSVQRSTDRIIGHYRAPAMSVAVVLKPSHAAALHRQAAAIYSRADRRDPHWLHRGQFVARYGPTSAQRAAVVRYLRHRGLTVHASKSPFMVNASGSSARVSATFGTELRTFVGSRHVHYFANTRAVHLPATVGHGVLGVVGLTNTIRMHSDAIRAKGVQRSNGHSSGGSSCETPYPTAEQLFDTYVNGAPLPFGYGAGPGCQGLSPSQDNSLYGAPYGGRRVKGRGSNVALFELSAYQQSDIDTWAHQFYGKRYNPSLVDIDVDGGPLDPQCPVGDTCPPEYNGYAGDIEVDADIQMSLAIAPANRNVLVYNAPNDFTGQTELDEYTAIANQDTADTISSSWGVCENDVTPAYVQAENLVFEQMALQGQSLFAAAGDTGAFDCIRSDGTTIQNVMDPGGEPWITSVGGTSLANYNPGTNPHPSYPRAGESVWNVDNLCANNGDLSTPASGLWWCEQTGAGGGGSSQYWGRPWYQQGPGVNNPNTTYGNGTTQCSLAANGTPCRELPDVSINADEFTPYAEYCTGSAATPYSVCATFSGAQTPPGWFGIGGTSLASPFVAAIIADRDSYTGHRTGLANWLFYTLLNTRLRYRYFHDITGAGQVATNNGLFPTTRNYDEATGIGSPIMAPIITGVPAGW